MATPEPQYVAAPPIPDQLISPAAMPTTPTEESGKQPMTDVGVVCTTTEQLISSAGMPTTTTGESGKQLTTVTWSYNRKGGCHKKMRRKLGNIPGTTRGSNRKSDVRAWQKATHHRGGDKKTIKVSDLCVKLMRAVVKAIRDWGDKKVLQETERALEAYQEASVERNKDDRVLWMHNFAEFHTSIFALLKVRPAEFVKARVDQIIRDYNKVPNNATLTMAALQKEIKCSSVIDVDGEKLNYVKLIYTMVEPYSDEDQMAGSNAEEAGSNAKEARSGAEEARSGAKEARSDAEEARSDAEGAGGGHRVGGFGKPSFGETRAKRGGPLGKRQRETEGSESDKRIGNFRSLLRPSDTRRHDKPAPRGSGGGVMSPAASAAYDAEEANAQANNRTDRGIDAGDDPSIRDAQDRLAFSDADPDPDSGSGTDSD